MNVALKHPKIETREFEITSLSPLLVQNWATKVLKPFIVCCYGRKPRSVKERVFESFLDSLYIIDQKKIPRQPIGPGESWPFIKGAFGVPAGMFRKSLLNGARLLRVSSSISGVSVVLKAVDELVPICYSRLVLEATPVWIGISPNKMRDIRIRGKFEGWSAKIKVRFDANRISGKQILTLLRAAGNFSGIGAWRPEMNGDYGRFKVMPAMKSV